MLRRVWSILTSKARQACLYNTVYLCQTRNLCHIKDAHLLCSLHQLFVNLLNTAAIVFSIFSVHLLLVNTIHHCWLIFAAGHHQRCLSSLLSTHQLCWSKNCWPISSSTVAHTDHLLYCSRIMPITSTLLLCLASSACQNSYLDCG